MLSGVVDGDNGALQAMLDAFDNAKQGLGIWDEKDNLLGFNKIYGDILEKNLLIKPALGINFSKTYGTTWQECLKDP